MRTHTVTVREGELLGPVDWSYDFASHGWDRGGSINPKVLVAAVEALRRLDEGIARGEEWDASNGGWLRRVLAVGMYDGWPYWKPTPSVLLESPYGGEWCSVFMLKGARVGVPDGERAA